MQVPAGAKVDRRRGRPTSIPGFINARTTLGLNEPGPRGFDDVNEMLDFNQQLRTRVAYHADSDAIPVARANGITTVGVTPGGGICRRPGRGDEPRRLDVGRSDAQARTPASRSTSRRSAAAADAAAVAAARRPRRRPERTYDD